MIHDADHVQLPQDNAIAALANAEGLTAYLSGSRFMECAHEGSDWDFMMQDSGLARAWLVANGFAPDRMPAAERAERMAEGSLTVGCWERAGDGYAVQVCLVTDVQLQRKVRDVIRTHLREAHQNARHMPGARRTLWASLARVLAFDPEQEVMNRQWGGIR